MLTVARGFTMLYTGGHPISNLGEGFAFIGTGSLLGIPVPVWIAAVVVLLAVFITQKTKLGDIYMPLVGMKQPQNFPVFALTG